MTLETLGYLGEFVGGIAVIVSLVYLARQVHQNTKSLRTESYARALERVAAIQSRLSSDSAMAHVLARGAFDPAALTVEERIQLSWTCYEMFGAFEFIFHQAKSGALADEVWARWAATLAWWISLPAVRAWWESKPAPFSADFSALIDSRADAAPADPEAARRFQAFLGGSGMATSE